MRVCDFDGCHRQHDANGFCSGHNMQRYKGRELKPLRVWEYKSLADMMLKSETAGDCVLWTGTLDKSGYGRMGFQRERNVLVHRVAYFLSTGEDINGSQIHHTCATRRCFNPEHLQRASKADNVLEMLARKDYEAEIAMLKAQVASLQAELDLERRGVVA